MKKVFAIVLMIAAALEAAAGNFEKDSVMIAGNVRHFTMYLPDNLQDGAPLVMVCHGYGNRGKEDTWMNEAADRHGFAVCIPVGMKDVRGKNCWNVGYPWQRDWELDDVRTMTELASHVQDKYALSRENCFFTGMSNGGELCYLLAYSNQHTFKALASVSGLTMKWFVDELEVDHAIPFLEVHGTADKTSEWNGDIDNKGGWGEYLSVPMAVAPLVVKAHATHEVVDTMQVKDPSNGHSVVKHSYVGGRNGVEVWLYEVIGGTHSWHDKDIDTGEEIWKFFSKYIR